MAPCHTCWRHLDAQMSFCNAGALHTVACASCYCLFHACCLCMCCCHCMTVLHHRLAAMLIQCCHPTAAILLPSYCCRPTAAVLLLLSCCHPTAEESGGKEPGCKISWPRSLEPGCKISWPRSLEPRSLEPRSAACLPAACLPAACLPACLQLMCTRTS